MSFLLLLAAARAATLPEPPAPAAVVFPADTAVATGPAALDEALRIELDRALTLRLPDAPAPYFVGYDVLDGTVKPGQVFDLTVPLDQVADGYRAMDERTAIKTMLTL